MTATPTKYPEWNNEFDHRLQIDARVAEFLVAGRMTAIVVKHERDYQPHDTLVLDTGAWYDPEDDGAAVVVARIGHVLPASVSRGTLTDGSCMLSLVDVMAATRQVPPAGEPRNGIVRVVIAPQPTGTVTVGPSTSPTEVAGWVAGWAVDHHGRLPQPGPAQRR